MMHRGRQAPEMTMAVAKLEVIIAKVLKQIEMDFQRIYTFVVANPSGLNIENRQCRRTLHIPREIL